MSPPPGFWHNHAEPCGVEGCEGIVPLTAKHVQEMIDAHRAMAGAPLFLEERIDFVHPEMLRKMREETEKP